jgi:aminopeptidase N
MKSANFHDFTGCFDKITDKVSVRKFMENWLNEPGFPMVKVTKVSVKTSPLNVFTELM